jgi:hypothetical protein
MRRAVDVVSLILPAPAARPADETPGRSRSPTANEERRARDGRRPRATARRGSAADHVPRPVPPGSGRRPDRHGERAAKVGQRLREDGQAFRAAARQAQNLREVGLRGIPSLLSERQLRDRILDGLRRRVRVRLLLAQEPVDVLGAANVARSTSARPIRLALSQSMGTKRGKGERSFVLETRKQAIGFYRDLVQNLRPWRAAPPKLPDEPEDTPEAATP